MYFPAGADEDVRGGTYIYIAHGTYVRIFVAGGNGFHRSLYEGGVLSMRCFPRCCHSAFEYRTNFAVIDNHKSHTCTCGYI